MELIQVGTNRPPGVSLKKKSNYLIDVDTSYIIAIRLRPALVHPLRLFSVSPRGDDLAGACSLLLFLPLSSCG